MDFIQLNPWFLKDLRLALNSYKIFIPYLAGTTMDGSPDAHMNKKEKGSCYG